MVYSNLGTCRGAANFIFACVIEGTMNIETGSISEEKIDMTVPVRTRIIPAPGPACEDNFTMSFFLSQKIRDPPQPTDTDVFIDRLPQKYMVYVR